MGPTVLIKQAAATHRHPDGRLIYFLYELTRDDITGDAESVWNCIAIGTYTQVLCKVFVHAGACETGALVGPSSALAPEQYLENWRSAMAAPRLQQDATIELRVDESIYGPISLADVDAVANLMASSGRQDLAVQLNHGKAQFQLHSDIDLVLTIFGTQGVLPPRIALAYGAKAAPGESDVPAVAAGEPPPFAAQVYAVGDTERLVSIGGNSWDRWGWQLSAVARFITNVACQLELDHPGTAGGAIAQFRALCVAARPLPGATIVHVRREVNDLPAWYVQCADNLAHQLGIACDDEPAPAYFDCSYQQAVATNALYHLCSLSPLQVTWSVPATAPAALAAQQHFDHRSEQNGGGNWGQH